MTKKINFPQVEKFSSTELAQFKTLEEQLDYLFRLSDYQWTITSTLSQHNRELDASEKVEETITQYESKMERYFQSFLHKIQPATQGARIFKDVDTLLLYFCKAKDYGFQNLAFLTGSIKQFQTDLFEYISTQETAELTKRHILAIELVTHFKDRFSILDLPHSVVSNERIVNFFTNLFFAQEMQNIIEHDSDADDKLHVNLKLNQIVSEETIRRKAKPYDYWLSNEEKLIVIEAFNAVLEESRFKKERFPLITLKTAHIFLHLLSGTFISDLRQLCQMEKICNSIHRFLHRLLTQSNRCYYGGTSLFDLYFYSKFFEKNYRNLTGLTILKFMIELMPLPLQKDLFKKLYLNNIEEALKSKKKSDIKKVAVYIGRIMPIYLNQEKENTAIFDEIAIKVAQAYFGKNTLESFFKDNSTEWDLQKVRGQFIELKNNEDFLEAIDKEDKLTTKDEKDYLLQTEMFMKEVFENMDLTEPLAFSKQPFQQ